MRRRDFLAHIGRAAGSTAVLRTMVAMGLGTSAMGCGSSSDGQPFRTTRVPETPRPSDWPVNAGAGKSVVILGAGIAGMTTALEMRRLGYACTLLEANAVAGGRTRTLRSGDDAVEIDSSQTCDFDADPELYFNPGPARIPHHHELLLGYCREFGVAMEPFINDNGAALIHSTNAFGGQPQLARRIITDTRGHVAALLATAIDQGDLDDELDGVDASNVLAMLEQLGDLDGRVYRASSRAGFPGQENVGSRQRGALLAPLELSDLVSDTLLQVQAAFPQSFDQQSTMLQPTGGMDRIARAFEAQVVDDIIYEAVVTEIRKTMSGARIGYEDATGAAQSIEADYCVCTIPTTVLRSIPNDFSSAHGSAISGFNYTQATKIAFQSRRFWEQDHNIYGGISWTNQNITQVWYPSAGLGQDTGVVVGSYIFGGTAGVDFANQSIQQRISSTARQANAIHPEFEGEVSRGISVAWSKVPFQLGGWGVSDPGVLLTPDDAIHFAGEHLSILQGWQEGAILSAYRAIDAIVARDV